MAYRYYVIGTAAIVNDNGSGPQVVKKFSNDEWTLDKYADKKKYPLCVASKDLISSVKYDSWCKQEMFDGGFPKIAIVPVISTVAGAKDLKKVQIQLGHQIKANASQAAHMNWWFVLNTLFAFKVQVAYRKAVIKALAKNLARPITSGGMRDLYGDFVYTGAEKTFRYNLSESNKSLGQYSIEIKNSLESGACRDQKVWLPGIPVLIAPAYGDIPDKSGPGASGQITSKWFSDKPDTMNNSKGIHFMELVDPHKILRETAGIFSLGADPEATLGFEKKPLVYSL